MSSYFSPNNKYKPQVPYQTNTTNPFQQSNDQRQPLSSKNLQPQIPNVNLINRQKENNPNLNVNVVNLINRQVTTRQKENNPNQDNVDGVALKNLFKKEIEKNNSLNAAKIFNQLLETNCCSPPVYNSLIICHANTGNLDKAFELLKIAPLQKVKIYHAVIKESIAQKKYYLVELLVEEMKNRKLNIDIGIYFLRIKSALAQEDNFEIGLEIFNEMKLSGIKPTVELYTIIVKECFKRNKPLLAIGYIECMRTVDMIEPNDNIYGVAIKYLCKNDGLSQVRKTVNEMTIPFTEAFLATLIYAVGIDGKNPNLALSYFDLINKHNLTLNDDIANAMLDVLMEIDVTKASQLFKERKLAIKYKEGLLDCHGLSRGWAFVQILEHIEKNPHSDLTVCTGKGLHSIGNELYKMRAYILEKSNIYKDLFKNYQISVPESNTGLLEFKFVYQYTKAAANESKEHFWKSLNNKNTPEENVQHHVNQIKQSDSITSIAMPKQELTRLEWLENISYSLRNYPILETLRMVEEMKHCNHSLDRILYNVLITETLNAGFTFKGVTLFQEMIQNNITPTRNVYHELIKLHLKKAEFPLANKIFNEMKIPPNVETYNLFIRAYVTNNYFGAASDMYSTMLSKNVQPNQITLDLMAKLKPYAYGFSSPTPQNYSLGWY